MKFSSFLKAIRIKNSLLAIFGGITGYLLSFPEKINLGLLPALLAIFFISSAGNVINNVEDYEIDRKLKKNNPFAKKEITLKEGKALYTLFFILGIISGFFCNFIVFLISVLASLLLFAYSKHMKGKKYLGNYVVSLNTSLTFIVGALAGNGINIWIVAIFISSFLGSLAREIIKDVEDYEKGEIEKNTLPKIKGVEFSRMLSTILIFIAVFANIIPFFVSFPLIPFLLLAIGDIFALKSCFEDAKKAQKTLKISMLFVVIAYFLVGLLVT